MNLEAGAQALRGKRIASIDLKDDVLWIGLDKGDVFARVLDAGQQCCEHRYMRTDDDLQDFVGAEIRGLEVRGTTRDDSGHDSADVQFLLLQTDKGDLTLSNHNNHNGYYGGFDIEVLLGDAP